MNKTELIDSIATQADISKAAAGRALDAAVETIKAALKAGDTVVADARRQLADGTRVRTSLN